MIKSDESPNLESLAIKPITDDEVFIGWQNTITCLAPNYTKHTNFGVVHGLWQSILQNAGPVFDETETLIRYQQTGMKCVRIIGAKKPLVSVDGLVDGLVEGSLTNRTGIGIGSRRSAAIVQLARTFTPDRELEIAQAEEKYSIPALGHKRPHWHYF